MSYEALYCPFAAFAAFYKIHCVRYGGYKIEFSVRKFLVYGYMHMEKTLSTPSTSNFKDITSF